MRGFRNGLPPSGAATGHGTDIRVGEVIALTKQRQIADLRQRIGKHIAKIQCRRMPTALAMGQKRPERLVHVHEARRDVLEPGQRQRIVEQCNRPGPRRA